MMQINTIIGLASSRINCALVGGMRSLGISSSGDGVFTSNSDELGNDFFMNLLSMNTEWKPSGDNSYEGSNRSTGDKVNTASRADLVFGSNSTKSNC